MSDKIFKRIKSRSKRSQIRLFKGYKVARNDFGMILDNSCVILGKKIEIWVGEGSDLIPSMEIAKNCPHGTGLISLWLLFGAEVTAIF